jgi:hypothetical protein
MTTQQKAEALAANPKYSKVSWFGLCWIAKLFSG